MTRAVERRPVNPSVATKNFLQAQGTGGTLSIANDMMQDALAGLESILSRALSRAVSDINAELRKGFKELRVSLAQHRSNALLTPGAGQSGQGQPALRVSGPLGPGVAGVVAGGVGAGGVGVGDLLADPVFAGMVSEVFGFARMPDFEASVAAMSPEDIDDVLAGADQYDEAAEEALVAVTPEEEPQGTGDRLLDLVIQAASAGILSE